MAVSVCDFAYLLAGSLCITSGGGTASKVNQAKTRLGYWSLVSSAEMRGELGTDIVASIRCRLVDVIYESSRSRLRVDCPKI